jgi:hypothetical protein
VYSADAKPERASNRLIGEKSPYLLQHSENPVDWYPWGEEAFQKAKKEDKPIFLSIGYATCHWCHVMAHESLEDGEVAEYLNQHYVSIKVDREERLDVNKIYMLVCHRGRVIVQHPLLFLSFRPKGGHIRSKSQYGLNYYFIFLLRLIPVRNRKIRCYKLMICRLSLVTRKS